MAANLFDSPPRQQDYGATVPALVLAVPSSVPALSNVASILSPSVDIAVIAATAIRAAIRPYSMAVAPFLSRSEEHTSELQSLMRISYAVFCLKKKIPPKTKDKNQQ